MIDFKFSAKAQGVRRVLGTRLSSLEGAMWGLGPEVRAWGLGFRFQHAYNSLEMIDLILKGFPKSQALIPKPQTLTLNPQALN